MSLENAHLLRRCLEELGASFGERLVLDEGFGTVSAVGAGQDASHANLRKALAALEMAGIDVASLWTGAYQLGFVVKKVQVANAVRTLHAALVE